MGFFDFLRQPDVNQGVNDYKTPLAPYCLTYVPHKNTVKDISREVKTFHCKRLTK